jgi:hypothetical protein
MSQNQDPDLVHGSSAEKAEAPASANQVEIRKASTFQQSAPTVAKEKDLREIILCQTELAGLSEATGWLALSSDRASHEAKIGGLLAGLLRVEQRLKGMLPQAIKK